MSAVKASFTSRDVSDLLPLCRKARQPVTAKVMGETFGIALHVRAILTGMSQKKARTAPKVTIAMMG